jgi:arrestin-related trafficking adapter 1
MEGPLVAISYEFKAEAVPKVAGHLQTPIQFKKTLEVKRSLGTSELPHHSVRVFPPTNIKASAHYPHIIHPIGTYNLNLKLDGISRHNANVDTMEYWRMKKLTWRLEETAKTVAPACDKHSPKVEGADQQQKKGLIRTETRVIGEKTLFSGWKSNYTSTTDSSIELELECNLAKHAKYACDTKSRDGTEVTHQLMVEMVVSQEWAPVNKPTLVTHTGVGRILRMHFGIILTERAGIGISWDNEAPPIYQDVPPSPPAYFHETILDGESSIDELMEPLDTMDHGPGRESTDSSDSSVQEPHSHAPIPSS